MLYVCVCVYEKKQANEQTKNRATCFFSYLTTQTSFVFTHIRTKRHTKKEGKKKKAAGCLARPTNKKKKEKDQEKKEMKTDHTVTTTTATKDEKKKERATIMHTHTHAHIKNGTRDEVREK